MKIIKSEQLKKKPDFNSLGFGKYFTDHMLYIDYNDGKWGEVTIAPYAPFLLDPATAVLHYAQGIFEGCKAYKDNNGKITLFRTRDNFKRMNESAARMCMPAIDIDAVMEGLIELLKIESEWIPSKEGTSLYIRPTMIATETQLGVHASRSYRFFIILSPVGAYYANGLKPTRILIENNYIRAAIGGTGEAKCMGNYAASLLAAEKAVAQGYDQVMWLDAQEKKYVEEVGSMNMFFVIDGVVVTPKLSGSILPGITRRSVIEVLIDKGYKVQEKKISVDELMSAYNSGKLNEAFGTGTAAVIAPVGTIAYNGVDMQINGGNMGEVTSMLYDTITGIQLGKIEDKYNWVIRAN